MTFTDKQVQQLRADLPAEAVKTRKQFGNGGGSLSYIEGWYAIHQANELLGYDAWSAETVRLDEKSRDLGKDSKGNEQWQVSFLAVVRVRCGDVVRDGTGFGSGFAKQVGDAIEGAAKEAETDALKRALRTFGNQFGNALYDKTQANVEGTPANEQKAKKADLERENFTKFMAKLRGHTSAIQLEKWFNSPKVVAYRNGMKPGWQHEAVEAFEAKNADLIDKRASRDAEPYAEQGKNAIEEAKFTREGLLAEFREFAANCHVPSEIIQEAKRLKSTPELSFDIEQARVDDIANLRLNELSEDA